MWTDFAAASEVKSATEAVAEFKLMSGWNSATRELLDTRYLGGMLWPSSRLSRCDV